MLYFRELSFTITLVAIISSPLASIKWHRFRKSAIHWWASIDRSRAARLDEEHIAHREYSQDDVVVVSRKAICTIGVYHSSIANFLYIDSPGLIMNPFIS